MAVGTYETTHKKILDSGRAHFLENGYERTNLRDLCSTAGITTGAFYRHFEDKEALFSELVEPALKGLDSLVENAEGAYFNCVTDDKIGDMWNISAETMAKFIEYIYSFRDAFKLLLYCSDGTKYTNFIDRLVEWEVKDTKKMYELMNERGIPHKELDEREEHMLYYAFYSSIFECIFHDFEEEAAIRYARTIAEFFSAGWRTVHCL